MTPALENTGLPRMTAEDYLAHEATSEVRHEFHAGEVLAMSGAMPPHSRLSMRLAALLVNGLDGTPCVPYSNELGISVEASARYFYPDASVICGEMEHDAADRNGRMATNPRVVFEILSDSTGGYDRGEKFKNFMKLESLQEYVLLEQDEPCVQSFLRQDDGTWNLATWSGLDAVAEARCLPLDLPLTKLYPAE